ncbi:MAG: DUF58 domain-containing protein [Acidimicrobiales bacterium]
MLTRRGRFALSGFVVLWFAGRVLGVTELVGVAFAIGALVLVSYLRVKLSRAKVSLAARLSPEVIEAGNQCVLELFVENIGLGPTPASRLQLLPSKGGRHRILVPRLAPGERATVTIGLDSSHRGRHAVAGYEAVMTDGLGLASLRLTSTGSIGYLVRPRTEELPRTLPLSAGSGRESLQSSAERLRTGIAMLRQYIPGDDVRRIHWKTTARVGDLMVREGGDPDAESRSGTSIILGTGGEPSDDFERAIEVAASLVATAAREGNVRLLTTGDYDSGFESGAAHSDAIASALSTIEATGTHVARHRARRRWRAGQADSDGAPEGRDSTDDAKERAGEAVLGRLVHRSSASDWHVLVTVEACTDADEAELSPDILSGLPGRVGNVVSVLVGAEVARFERISRSQVVVYLPADRAMHDIWNMAFDLPVGEIYTIDVVPTDLDGGELSSAGSG